MNASGSSSVLHQVNTSRAGMTGVNKRPIPPGTVTTHPNGGMSVAASGGRNYNVRPNGSLSSFSGHNEQAHFRPDGRVGSVHTPNMDISHGARGERTVVAHRPDGTVVVRSGARAGYVQRTVVVNHVSYVQRTYVVGPRVYTRAFMPYTYRGIVFHSYMPGFYFGPPFYGWAYYPWGAPVPYAWPWLGEPWYGFYGPYFTIAPLYPSPAFWLTDFYMSQMLALSYQSQIAGQVMDAPDYDAEAEERTDGDPVYAEANTPVTPEIKQAIAEEIKDQIAYENAAAQKPAEAASLTGLPQVLKPNRVFVVDATLDATTAENASCELSPGDVLKLAEVPAEGATTANLKVASSRRGGCPAGILVTLSLDQLQDMQNSLRANLDSGLQALRDGQGKNGLPAAPMEAIAAPARPVDDLPPAVAQEEVQALLQSVDAEADQTENRIERAAFDTGQTVTTSAKQ
ncbi:MAG: hypothetical protein ABSD96_17850 [Candidatus Korobacteraceae bacterium]